MPAINFKVFPLCLLWALLLPGAMLQAAGQEEPLTISEDLNLREWGIRNGCIATHAIRNINFPNDQSALITLSGGKKVMLQFRDRCPGIRYNGFVYQTSTGQLCAGFDAVRVLDSGWFCTIDSFQPYLELEE